MSDADMMRAVARRSSFDVIHVATMFKADVGIPGLGSDDPRPEFRSQRRGGEADQRADHVPEEPGDFE
jgi:hypothetical protein